MTVTLEFESGTEHIISNVTYFAWNGRSFACERIPDTEDEKIPYPWSPAKSVFSTDACQGDEIVKVTIITVNATFRAETEYYSVHRGMKEISFNVTNKHFLGNLFYAGSVSGFSANEN